VDEIAERAEKRVGIVVVEKARDVEAGRPRAREGRGIADCAGRIGRPVDPVGPDAGEGKRGRAIFRGRETRAGGKGDGLFSAAAASTNSWFRPPRPRPVTVTVVSSLETMQVGRGTSAARASAARRCDTAAVRASPTTGSSMCSTW
jgi:hypothetical protein